MPRRPPTVVPFWCVVCDRAYIWHPGYDATVPRHRSGQSRFADYERDALPPGLCDKHAAQAARGLSGMAKLKKESHAVRDYYRRRWGLKPLKD